MRAAAEFSVESFAPTDVAPTPAVSTGTPVGVATMVKRFEGSLHGRDGTFNFAHSTTTSGSDRSAEFFVIVPSSGTG